MAKVVFGKTEKSPAPADGRKRASVKMKRIRSDNGKTTSLRVLDSGSESFADDFARAFAANVKKARAENKRVTGVTDRAPGER